LPIEGEVTRSCSCPKEQKEVLSSWAKDPLDELHVSLYINSTMDSSIRHIEKPIETQITLSYHPGSKY
jgi:hypothetical protein